MAVKGFILRKRRFDGPKLTLSENSKRINASVKFTKLTESPALYLNAINLTLKDGRTVSVDWRRTAWCDQGIKNGEITVSADLEGLFILGEKVKLKELAGSEVTRVETKTADDISRYDMEANGLHKI